MYVHNYLVCNLSPLALANGDPNTSNQINVLGKRVCLQVPIVDQPHAILLACHFTVVAECIHQNQSGSTLGVSLRQAHEWVLKYRPHIRPNAVFWRQQREYEKRFYGKNTEDGCYLLRISDVYLKSIYI
uniref:Uncharacterized protein n=1 Tax=Hucho hucho TaxID=62062 RepID=A0A4W5PUW5_9TELE